MQKSFTVKEKSKTLAHGRKDTIDVFAKHVPVLPDEVLEGLLLPPGGVVVDATVGLGGHAAIMLEQIGPSGCLIGIDVDESNLLLAEQRLARWNNVKLFRENFVNLETVLKKTDVGNVDAVLADLGVSSSQLNDPCRGFSFTADGPLDMRFDDRLTVTAADLVNRLRETELADMIYHNSQERFSRRIARAIRLARHDSRITTTCQLAEIICDALKQDPTSRKGKIHPATRTFMALRIAVNRELETLETFLGALPKVLKPGGRAGVISFHSLEDGLCKRTFRRMKDQGLAKIITKKPVTPSAEERKANPRSRSAKFRVIERTRLN